MSIEEPEILIEPSLFDNCVKITMRQGKGKWTLPIVLTPNSLTKLIETLIKLREKKMNSLILAETAKTKGL